MKDRRLLGGALVRRLAIKIVVEDGFDRTVGPGADLDRPCGRGFKALGTEGPCQADNAEARSEALFGMRPIFQDQIAQD
jgi:hypothetical protein